MAPNEPGSPKNYSDRRERYPILDALVASGLLHDHLSLSEMLDASTCSFGLVEDPQADVSDAVPQIIAQALSSAKRNQGRILEFTDQKYDVSENYEVQVQGVTLSCFVLNNDDREEFGPAAYASHILISALDVLPTTDDIRAYNLSMLVEAEIIELGSSGMFYIPKRYCFDFNDPYDYGISEGGKDAWGTASKKERIQTIHLGTKPAMLTSLRNQVLWINLNSAANKTGGMHLIKNAYNSPKAELIALSDAIDEGEGDCCEWCTYEQCTEEAKRRFGKYGLEYDASAAMTAMAQAKWMTDRWFDWQELVAKRFPKHFDIDELQDQFPEVDFGILQLNYQDMFPTPLIFDRSVASMDKNTPLRPPVQVNPYHVKTKFDTEVGLKPGSRQNPAKCLRTNDTADTSPTFAAAVFLQGALNRRQHEHVGKPQEQLWQWSTFENLFSTMTLAANKNYLVQNVSFDSNNGLLSGNLTEKAMGKTAEWLMVTDFTNSSDMYNLLEAQWETDTYSKTAAAAVQDNPCADAASNTDIYLLILGMAVAACGGVETVLATVHHLIYWMCRHCSGEERKVVHPFWRRMLPTYELWLIVLGALIFATLYVPVYMQVSTEIEISNYETSSAYADVNYAPYSDKSYQGKMVLVTLAHTQTSCTEARPTELIVLFAVGLGLGIVLNIPFIQVAGIACIRYFTRLCKVEKKLPSNTSVCDKELRILSPLEQENPLLSNEESEEETATLVTENGAAVTNPETATKTSSQATQEEPIGAEA